MHRLFHYPVGAFRRKAVYNYDVGSSLYREILEAFEQAQKAAERYGDFVSAIMGGIESEIESITKQIEALDEQISNLNTKNDDEDENTHNVVIGPSNQGYQTEASAIGKKASEIANQMKENSLAHWTAFGSDRTALEEANKAKAQEYEEAIGDKLEPKNGSWYSTITGTKLYSISKDDIINAIVAKMEANAEAWKTADESEKAQLDSENLELGLNRLKLVGVNAVRGTNGVWYIGSEGGEKLFEKYHRGGFVNNKTSVDRKEVPAILQEGELVLDEPKKEGLYKLIDFADILAGKVRNVSLFKGISPPTDILQSIISALTPQIPENITLRSEVAPVPPVVFNLYNNGTLDKGTWNKIKSFVGDTINNSFLTVCKDRG